LPACKINRMRIPIKSESADDFIERVYGLLQDKRTHVYFDTSFLMWLTTIGPISRQQFFAWAGTLGDRTHVPLWSMHEYYRHHRNRTLKRRLEKGSRKLDAAAKAFISDVEPYADRPLLPGQPDGAYLEALRLAAGRLEELTSLANTWDYDASAFETLTWMNARSCSTDTVFKTMPTLTAYGSGRYTQDLPPGYEDRRKRDKVSRGSNRYGDLLFWEEVMVHAKTSKAATVVVVTNDRKRDWFFKLAEPEIDSGWKRLRSRWDPVPVPHPTLSFELKMKSGIDRLELLDQLYLGAVIWKKRRPQFERFASIAINIRPGQETDKLGLSTVKPSHKRSDHSTIGLMAAIALSHAAVAAPDAATSDLLGRIEGGAPEAETFVDQLSEAELSALQPPQMACFARSLHDRALAGSGPAQALTSRLLGMLGKLSADSAACVYLGLATSAYFENDIPRDRPTSHLLEELFAWQDDTALPKILSVMARRLAKARSPALYAPNAANRRVAVKVEHDSRKQQTPAELKQVYFGRTALLTSDELRPERQLRNLIGGATEASVHTIVRSLCSYYGVPWELTDVLGGESEEPRSIPELSGIAEFDRFSASGGPSELPEGPVDEALEEADVLPDDIEFDELVPDEEDESE
jgi:hypothetical protein